MNICIKIYISCTKNICSNLCSNRLRNYVEYASKLERDHLAGGSFGGSFERKREGRTRVKAREEIFDEKKRNEIFERQRY